MMRLWLATVIVAISVATPASAHNLWVTDNPQAGADCFSDVKACSIATALSLSIDGPNLIEALPGTYNNVDTSAPGVVSGSYVTAYGAGNHVIASPDATPALTIANSINVTGFTIRSSHPVVFTGDGRLTSNTVEGVAAPANQPLIAVQPGAGGAILDRTTITDDTPANQVGIKIDSPGSPQAIGNTGVGLAIGIQTQAGTPILQRNSISSSTTGVSVEAGAPTLSANSLIGNTAGITAAAGSTVNSFSDLVARGGTGIGAVGANVSATNLTAADNGVDLDASAGTTLSLDSSYVSRPIAISGGSTCAVAFSAGPASAGCPPFALPADAPGFSNPAAGDYTLTAGSPLIDAGDPADPPAGALDLNGSPRALKGSCAAGVRRDIGADEFSPDCVDAPPDGGGPGGPSGSVGDIDPPDTRIDRVKVRRRHASIRFSSDEPKSSFLCRLDGARFKRCRSPKRFRHLARGVHVFRVRAVDAAGNTDGSAARRRFRVG